MELKKYDGNINDIDFMDMLMLDIFGNIKHVTLPKGNINEKVMEKGIGFDASNFGFAKVTASDMVAVPDMDTAFLEIKDEFNILHVFCDVKTTDGKIFDQYPRNIARKTVEYIQNEKIADDAKMLVELEFHVFDEVRYSTEIDHSYYFVQSEEGVGPDYHDSPRFSPQRGYHRLSPEDKYEPLRNEVVFLMEQLGIPVKYHHHEVSVCQLEIELNFMSLTEAADKVSISKWIIKSVADEMGLKVTFMPKPMYKLAGNGMHVHQFLEKDGKSLFPGDKIHDLSQTALSYTSGILEHCLTGSLLAFTNSSTNSFKRLVPGYEAPISATFAKGSRTAAIRIPGYLSKKDVRIEFRTGDATSNIHYMLSAMVLAGVDGIKRGADPLENGFDSKEVKNDMTFPLNLREVLRGLAEDSGYLKPAFPESLIKTWIKILSEEADAVYNAPTPQEYELYF